MGWLDDLKKTKLSGQTRRHPLNLVSIDPAGQLTGRIYFHQGADAAFVAVRAGARRKRGKKTSR